MKTLLQYEEEFYALTQKRSNLQKLYRRLYMRKYRGKKVKASKFEEICIQIDEIDVRRNKIGLLMKRLWKEGVPNYQTLTSFRGAQKANKRRRKGIIGMCQGSEVSS